jgi:hypothetical protein
VYKKPEDMTLDEINDAFEEYIRRNKEQAAKEQAGAARR